MRIICLEGSHGCGKTELINELQKRNYNILDEGFLDMPEFSLHPQSLVMESIWVSRWIERVLSLQKLNDKDDVIYFADRSPFSVLLYASNGMIMKSVIVEQMMELTAAGIEIITVHVSVHPDILWGRIQKRLAYEPERKKFNEDNYDHMMKAVKFYERNCLWDYTIFNNEEGISDLIDFLENMIDIQ